MSKKWEDNKTVSWITKWEWGEGLTKEHTDSHIAMDFTIHFSPCRWPDCHAETPQQNEHGYIVMAKDNNKEVACGTHFNFPSVYCPNKRCHICKEVKR
jgi:hypothetical protein